MIKRFLAAAVLMAAFALPALAGGLSATTWDEALALSQKHDKPVLIDFFTEW